MLNAATDGRMWVENGVHLEQILKRNEKTHEGSEVLWMYMYEHFILPNVNKGRIKNDSSNFLRILLYKTK